MFTFKRKSKPKRKRGTPPTKGKVITFVPQAISESNDQGAFYVVQMGCLGQFNVPLRIIRDNGDFD